MKKKTRLTIYRSGIDMPVCITGGPGEGGELRQDPPKFTVTPEKADELIGMLSDPYAVLVFEPPNGVKTYIPVRMVAHVDRDDFVPAPTRVDLYQDPAGTLYLARADEDEGIVYRLPAFTADQLDSVYGGPFAGDAYSWCGEGEDPAATHGAQKLHLTKITNLPPADYVSEDTLTLVAWYHTYGTDNVEVVFGDNGQPLASLEARAYIGAEALARAVETHRAAQEAAAEPVPLY